MRPFSSQEAYGLSMAIATSSHMMPIFAISSPQVNANILAHSMVLSTAVQVKCVFV